MPNLNNAVLRSMPVFYPHLDVQVETPTATMHLSKKITNQRAQEQSLTDLFRTLLHQLMTAQIRVNDLDLEDICILNND